MRFALLLFLSLCACTSSVPDSGSGGFGGVPATSGGAVDASCATDASIACAPGSKQKVRCTGGKWQDDGACATGTSCIETKSAGVVVATKCAVPSTGRADLAAACAKILHCRGSSGSSMGKCVSEATFVSQIRLLYTKLGVAPADADDLVRLHAGSHTACLAGAKSCAAVGACVGGGQACGANVPGGCKGSVAWKCKSGVPFAFDCAGLGLQCGMIDDDAFCGQPTPCTGPDGISCSGDVALLCRGDKAKGFSGVKINCSGMGLTCSGGKDTFLGCVPKSQPACDPATYVDHCAGNTRLRCKKNLVAADDCSLTGQQCLVTPDVTPPATQCSYGLGCTAEPKCDGTRLEYCEAGKRVSLDCAAHAMVCGSANGAATCVFAGGS